MPAVQSLYFHLTSTSSCFSVKCLVYRFNDQMPAQPPKKHGLIQTGFSRRHRSLSAPEVAGAQEDLVSCNWIAVPGRRFSFLIGSEGFKDIESCRVFFFSHSDYVTMINS